MQSDKGCQRLDTFGAFADKEGMTHSLGSALTPALVDRLSQRNITGRLGTALPFVTVDPERDTPAVLSQYVPAFHADFLGLYGDADATARTAVPAGTP